jgi:peptidoglycan/LPS O-acetylase OafA/YrhL
MRYPALDGLRGLAALLVVISHFSDISGLAGGRLGHGGGEIGVMLFFLISGFLMGRLYLGETPDLKSIATFAQRRIARVIPLFLFVVLAGIVWTLIFGPTPGIYPITSENIVRHLTFREGVWVLWTIPVEVQFYALFVFLWIGASQVPAVVTWTLVLAAVVLFILNPFGFKEQKLGFHLAYFLSGVAVSIAHRHGYLPSSRWWNVPFVALLPFLVLLMPLITADVFGLKTEVWHSWLHLLVFTAFFATAIASPAAQNVFGNAIGRFFGDISYSIYLLQVPVLVYFEKHPMQNVYLAIVLFLLAITGLAWLSFRLIEKPARKAINGITLMRDDVPTMHARIRAEVQ